MIFGHPTRKPKSRHLVSAFVLGAVDTGRATHVFYGVDESNRAAWDAARRSGEDWVYLDNAYFDGARGTHFRAVKNGYQHRGRGHSDGVRFGRLGIGIAPMRQADAGHVVLCPQSADFLRFVGAPADWESRVRAQLAGLCPGREIRCRPWSPDKAALARTLAQDLAGAWALVTWSSAAAVTALLAGVPVFVGSPDCAAFDLSGRLDDAAAIRAFPAERERLAWASVLADHQWTVEEMRGGVAWRALHP